MSIRIVIGLREMVASQSVINDPDYIIPAHLNSSRFQLAYIRRSTYVLFTDSFIFHLSHIIPCMFKTYISRERARVVTCQPFFNQNMNM